MCDYQKYVSNKFMKPFIYYHSYGMRNGDDVSHFQFHEMVYCSSTFIYGTWQVFHPVQHYLNKPIFEFEW